MNLAQILSIFLWTLGAPYVHLPWFKILNSHFIYMYTLEYQKYLSLIYTIYANDLDNTPSYTYITLYVAWRVQPIGAHDTML